MRTPAVRWAVASFLVLTWLGAAGARAAVERGTLTIQSEPNVEVNWDGVLLGTTDPSGQMSIGNIPPGTYVLELDAPEYTARSESLDITPGSQRLDAPLAPQPDPGARLAPARDADAPVDEDIAQAPGPKPQDYKAITSLLVVAAVVVLTAFLLADRRSRRRQIEAKPQGPRIVVQGTSTPPKKLPTFYDDLKRRETDLEMLRDVGSGRSQRPIIDVEVEDHGPVEDDR